jgi:hypothetical protein
VGPEARALLEEGVSEQRSILWHVRGRGTARLFEERVTAYGELWTAFSASYAPDVPVDHCVGLEGGLRLAFGGLPFSASLRYRVERIDLGGQTRRETVEQVGFLIGVGRR